MKLKFPKKILIGDTPFDIKLDPTDHGANFSYWDGDKKASRSGLITIGTFHLKTNPIRLFSTIIHQLKKIIHIEQGTRFEDPTEKRNYQFHYHHKEHTELCSRLAGLLNEFIV